MKRTLDLADSCAGLCRLTRLKHLIWRYSRIILVVVGAISTTGCRLEKTTYAKGFDHQKFWQTTIHSDSREVLELVGVPIDATIRYYDGAAGNRPTKVSALTIDALVAASKTPSASLACYYSWQANTHLGYIHCELGFQNGRLVQKLESVVTE